MRIGLLGPSDGDAETLREAIEFLLDDMEVDQAVYLGLDEEVIKYVTSANVACGFHAGDPMGNSGAGFYSAGDQGSRRRSSPCRRFSAAAED